MSFSSGLFEGVGRPPCRSILPSSNNIVRIVVLTYWDNVIGPKALHVWKQNDHESTLNITGCVNASVSELHQVSESNSLDPDEAVKYVVGHTLHGELSKETTRSQNFRTEMFVVPHRNFLVNAIIFGVKTKNNDEGVGHSLSIVCDSDSLDYFLKLQYLCDTWQQRMAAQIRVHLSMDNISGGIEHLSSTLMNFCNMLCSLQLSGYKCSPMVSESYLSMRHMCNHKLLEHAIVSHLQTCGCSVVVGDDEYSVNLMLNTLAQFVQDKNLATCRPVTREKPWPYYSGILLQGLLKDQFGEADISSQDVLHSPYPVTIVDISHGKVRQSSNCHEHAILRYKVMKQELLNIISSEKIHSFPLGIMFQSITESGSIVPQLLVELSTLPPTESVLRRHIKDFYRKLEYKAVLVIKYLEYLRKNSLTFNARVLQKYVGLEDVVDFQIILSVAERLKPGIYSYVVTGGIQSRSN